MATAKEDMPISDARANITAVINRVQLLRWTVFLTNRGKPAAFVGPIKLGRLVRRAGGADAAAEILAQHLGVDIAEYEEEDEP